MTAPRRMMAIVGAMAMTLAIAVTAVVAGGPLRGLAAPASTGTTVSETSAGSTTAVAFDRAFSGADLADFTFTTAFGPGGDFGAVCQEFANNLASNLGVTADQLQAAIKKTLIQQIDAALAAGKLTSDQAQAARDRINSSTPGFCMNVGAGAVPAIGGSTIAVPAGLMDGDVLNAAATYFNITPDQFKQDLKDKSTLQGVAAKYGKDNDAGKAGLEAALEAALRKSLASHGLSADQVDQIASGFKQHFDMLYTAPLGEFGHGGLIGPGGMGGPGGPHVRPGTAPGPRGPRPTPSASPAPVVR